ncbi:MAG: DNA polymerase III subunit delta [Armatimonadota bacterium]|nr:DNA polymerase III subunit delta [Armatimonadota bacterium]MDR7437101.1 DNA polymerase III subunit delta [Armatimonadota bacterium]MDR7472446.1 DNA polymerase III subunit delta [Armatimonadota bacterium]MDR7506649.1 DNA polymerase III subunit delta [Armatimonadota bacterium]MDR7509207.1 DNA polymerase III subunit delta [Armatimonadota bacterium]
MPQNPDRPAGAAAHVYLLHGEEDLLVEQALRDLLDRLIPPEERALNLDMLRADEVDVADAITRVDTLPFFGQRRVVVIRDVDAWPVPAQDRLAAYLDRGSPPSALILVAAGLDRRRRLYGTIRRMGHVQEFPRLSIRELPAWIADRARSAGFRMDPDAADLLIARTGPGLRQLSLEMEKLFASCAGRDRITRADVDAVVSRQADTSIFALVDAVGERAADRALAALEEIVRDEAPAYVLFMIARQFRLLYRAAVLLARRRPGAALAEALGVPPFVARRLAAQARNFPLAAFPEIFGRLQDADRAVKSTGQGRVALQMLVARLCLDPLPGHRRHAAARDRR